MIKIVKQTEDKRIVYSGENNSVQTTAITFSILDDTDNQIGDGALNAIPSMNEERSISMTINLRSTKLDPADIFTKLPAVLNEGGTV